MLKITLTRKTKEIDRKYVGEETVDLETLVDEILMDMRGIKYELYISNKRTQV